MSLLKPTPQCPPLPGHPPAPSIAFSLGGPWLPLRSQEASTEGGTQDDCV